MTPVDFSPAYHQEYLRSDLSVDFTLFRKTDVQVSISCDDPTPLEGQTVTYSLRAVNNGPGPASGLGLNVPLPAGLSYVSSSDPAAYDAPGGQWDIGALAPGAVATLELTARPNPGTGGQVITTSLQVAHVNESDTDSGNDRRWATVTVVNVNDPPTEILFSAASVAENRPAGAWAGSFDTIDLDSERSRTARCRAGRRPQCVVHDRG